MDEMKKENGYCKRTMNIEHIENLKMKIVVLKNTIRNDEGSFISIVAYLNNNEQEGGVSTLVCIYTSYVQLLCRLSYPVRQRLLPSHSL